MTQHILPVVTLENVKKTTRCVECQKQFRLTEKQRQVVVEEVEFLLSFERTRVIKSPKPLKISSLQREVRFGCKECLNDGASYGPFTLL